MNIEFNPVDTIGAGAFGQPGARTFVIQARKGDAHISVLVEKEQVALLAAEAEQFLDRIDADEPGFEEWPGTATTAPVEEDEPLFRARLIGIGYDPERQLVLIELREDAMDEDDEDEDDEDEPVAIDEPEGHIAKLYATRAQIRAMVAQGTAAVSAGRPKCELCDFPMDPDGHICPRWN